MRINNTKKQSRIFSRQKYLFFLSQIIYTFTWIIKNISLQISKMLAQIFLSAMWMFVSILSACANNNCDPRCANSCSAQLDNNKCCDCVATYGGLNQYFQSDNFDGSNGATCSSLCPVGYYQDTSTWAGNGYYNCSTCDTLCEACSGPTNTDCQSCAAHSYKKNTTACYLLSQSDNAGLYGDSNDQNPCPAPYYGIYTTKKCQICPTGCSSCNIYLEREMPDPYITDYTMNNDCPDDDLCTYTLRCYTCDGGYALQEGFCIPTDQCRKYSKYNSTSASFNADDCACMDNFYLTGLTSCSKCDITCLTCTSGGSSDCASCPEGADEDSGQCNYNVTYDEFENWGATVLPSTSGTWTATHTPAITPWTSSQTNCPSTEYVFGYYGYTGSTINFGSASLGYVGNSALSAAHYGIHFRATVLFIDNWVNTISLIFAESSVQHYAHYFQMEDIVGQYICGRNYYDHHDVVDFWFEHNSTSNPINFQITTSHDGYAWGIKEVMMQVMKCDPSCSTCYGPTQNQCYTCSSVKETLVDGDCVCDIDSGYYNNSAGNDCVTNCSVNTEYLNNVTRSCTVGCSDFPLQFKYYDSVDELQFCVENCPNDFYKYYPNMSCVQDCYDSSIADVSNYYNYDGLDKVCYQDCPDGYYGDPVSGSCVTTCPSTYYVEGEICVQYCTSPTLAYLPTRECVSSCPTGYFQNTITHDSNDYYVCQEECTVTLSGNLQLGDNTTGQCVNFCPDGSYSDYTVHLCVAQCNDTSYKQIITVGMDTVRSCEETCDNTGNNLYGNNETGECVIALDCPDDTYADITTPYCVTTCTDILLFANNGTKTCESSCASGFRNNDTKMCVATCPSQNADGNPEYGDSLYTGYCLEQCVNDTFADNQTNRQCVRSCADAPVETYGQNFLCVFNCSSSTWADPNHAFRHCTTSCSYNNSFKSYGYNETRKCVEDCPDTEFGIVISTVPVCVHTCTGTFGYPETNLCVNECPEPYYGDPTGNRLCVLECPDGYFAENVTAAGVITTERLCVLTCSYGWADNVTRLCTIAPEDCQDGLFAHETNHKCVLPTQCTGFGDVVTRKCEPTCYSDSDVKYFGDPSTKLCVLVCPEDPDYFGDNSTNECESTCTQSDEVRDPQNMRRCITACSRSPLALFADFVDGTCVTTQNCSTDYYADNFTNQCEQDCQGTVLQYADPISRECVDVCERNYYGLNVSTGVGVCSQRCPIPEWADNLTVQCTTRCSTNTYGVNYTDPDTSENYGICESECPEGQYARDADNLCVSNCGADHWGNDDTNFCEVSPFDCPDGQYADNETHMCVYSTGCSLVDDVQHVADNITQECLPECPDNTASYLNYADMVKKLCVAVCPHDYFGYNATKQCQTECKDSSNAYTGEYADPQLRICVEICSAEPISTFGENDTFTCVEAMYCPTERWAEIEVNNRQCVQYCPDLNEGDNIPQKYADNVSKSCVQWCPTYFYGDLQRGWGMCVDVCPSTTGGELQFSDNLTKTCVTQCPLSESTWGDPLSLRCVMVCPDGYYAQQQLSRHCVDTCMANTWSQQIKRTCVNDSFDCPTVNGTHYYADDSTTTCVETCPQNVDTWGQNTTWKCQDDCTTGFKYNDTRVCIDICPPSLDGDGSFSDQGMCYFVCITTGFYRDPQNNRSCQSQCTFSPVQYYADSTTMKCVLECPVYPEFYFAYDDTKTCQTDCAGSTMKDHSTQKCVDTCPNNTFFDPNSDECVEQCPTDFSAGTRYYGDSTQAIPICVIDTDCPNNYFADDIVHLCVENCSNQQWKYTKNCITHCPDGYYGNQETGFCVVPTDCPTDHYANNQTRTCVSKCNGTFADTNAKTCVFICPDTYYADPYTRLCSLSCTNNATISLHKNIDNKTCVSGCSQHLFLDPTNNSCESTCPDPYYADRTTQTCVSLCPSVSDLYGQNDTNTCVEECDNDTNEFKYSVDRVCVTSCPSGYFRNNFTRYCVEECDNITYADDRIGYCVYNCSPSRYSLDDTNECVESCPQPYFKDPTTSRCVKDCPHAPTAYYKVITSNDRRCDTDCPVNEYRDSLNFQCVALCPPSPPTYADSSTDNCVSICPTMYANTQTRKCVSKCPDGQYAENTTRKCVYQCINGTDTYGDGSLAIPFCVSLCSAGLFADPYTLTCVGQCHTYPKMYGFDNGTHRICVESCPYPYVADNATHECEIYCNNLQYPYLDKASKSCVAECTSPVYQFSYMPLGYSTNGTCEAFCPDDTFALLTNNSCVTRCPDDLYGDTTNNTCYDNCTLANGRFADPTTNLCVDECPSDHSIDSYGDLFSRTCVESCPSDKGTIADANTRLCEPRCTLTTEYADPSTGKCVTSCPDSPMLFADPVTLTCVEDCSLYSERYGHIDTRVCVESCPNAGQYADDSTRLCVSADNCPDGYWGLNSTRVCVKTCPTDGDLYGDPETKTCVAACDTNYFADPSTRICVLECPKIPELFGRTDTDRCVMQCPDGTFADNQTRRCQTSCSTTPMQTYADNSTNRCVATCPTQPNYFASNKTYQCVLLCPTSPAMYADYSTRKCVEDCPGGEIETFADDSDRFCVRLCANGTFMQNSTRSCVANCDEGFADPESRYCIAVCPAYSYGYLQDRICVDECPEETPQLYAEDATHMCEAECLEEHGTFADDTSNRCVRICPVDEDLYAESETRKCVDQCPQSPLKFADFSTRTCVPECPEIPALFAINSSRVCTANCPATSWADNSTRKCVGLCPENPETYGDNSTWSCVAICPTQPMTYSDNSTQLCVEQCPSTPDYYADNYTQRCVKDCNNETYGDPNSRQCVQTCPQGWYGRNATMKCVDECSSGQFADSLLHLCVQKCSVDPIFYGNPDTHICVQECPASNHSFGNPLTQECVKYQNDDTSGCPDTYFADNSTRLCVQVCPYKEDTYGDNSTWKCVAQCPGGSQDTFSDNSTMRCVDVCPEYPEYYAEQYSRRCVFYCLEPNATYSGSFSDNSTRKCVEQCPSDPDYYSDNSTGRCVLHCPHNPLTFADNQTRRCVDECPSTPDIYGDKKTRRCVQTCPEEQSTYADPTSRLCVKVCPSPAYYGENDTNRCVQECPDGSFADNSSRLCVAVCPKYPDTYGDPSTNKCVSKCPTDPDIYADPLTQECVDRCPDGHYAQNDTRRCLPSCPMDKVNYADNLTNRCVEKCPSSESTYGDNSTRNCVLQCPSTPFTYADNMTQMCLTICNNVTQGGYAENQTRICVQKCPDNSYGNIHSRYCVRYCPDTSYAYPVDNLCVDECPEPYFADNSTWQCVEKCPVSELLFGESIDRTCTTMCPETTYADAYSQECVEHCPGDLYDTYAFEDNNTCLQQCPHPYFGYPVTYVCLLECLNPYYENWTDHRCYRCPVECEECTYPQNCISCVADHYLYSGMCLESCPTFPVITYANPNRVCGTAFQCTAGYFALNTTKSCVRECPSGYYKNDTLQACDSCISGCSYCRNATSCITCNSTLALWDDYTCHTYCSPLRRYYTDVGCVNVCPDGTYLKLTTCDTCSEICKRCIVQPQNCLTCANGYYLYNNLCTEKCPENTKAVFEDSSLYCKSCSETDCTVESLTYTVSQYIDNYKYCVRLHFNQDVTMLEDIASIIQIKQKTYRRRLQSDNPVNYTIIDYGNGEYVFVLDGFENIDENDLEFQLQILDPEAIISQSGSFPEDTRSTVVIKQTNYYSEEDSNSHMVNFAFLVCVIGVIAFVFLFWTNHSIWVPFFDAAHLLFCLLFVNVVLPPTPTYVLKQFSVTAFMFLPSMFTPETAQYNDQFSNTIFAVFGDLMFVRNMGYLYTLLIVIVVMMLIMLILWKWKVKNVKKYCKVFVKEKFWNVHLHGMVYVLWLPTFMIGFIKMRDLAGESSLEKFSIFSAFLFMGAMLAVPIYFSVRLYRLFKQKLTFVLLEKAYKYIEEQQIALDENDKYYFDHDTNKIDVKNIHEPKVNQLPIIPFPIEHKFNRWSLAMLPLQYLYKTLIPLLLLATFSQPTAQLFILLFLTLLNLIYSIVVKPYFYSSYLFLHNNKITIHNLLIYTLIIIVILGFTFNYNIITYQNRLLIGDIIAGLILECITVNLVYMIARGQKWYERNLWKKFVATEMFQENYTVQYWQYKKEYEQEEKEQRKKSGSRTQFLHAVNLEKDKGLENFMMGFNTGGKISVSSKMPSSTSKLPPLNPRQFKNVQLRPNANKVLQKNITELFQTLNHEQAKSQKSVRSSERLSKQERNRVRQQVFKQHHQLPAVEQYEQMKIDEEKQKQVLLSQEANEENQTEYEYEYIEEEYPEDTDINEILKGCLKGDISLP